MLKKILFNFIFVFAFGVVPLILMEGLGRLFLPFPIGVSGTYQSDKKFIYFHKPNSMGYEVSDFSEFNPTKVEYDEYGFRGNSMKEGKKKIFIVGDSFVESRQVDENKTFVHLLQDETSEYRIINAGCSAFTTTTEFLLIKNKILALKPDKIFLFFTFNDYSDNFKYQSGYFKQTDIFENDPWEQFMPEAYRNVADPNVESVADWLKKKSVLFSYIHWKTRKKSPPPQRKEKNFSFAEDFVAVNIDDNELSEVDQEILKFTHRGLSETKKILDQNGVEMKVFIIPFPQQVNSKEWATGKYIYYDYPDVGYEGITNYQNRLMKFCRENKIECLDLLPEFKKNADRGKIFLDIDGHWTEYGQRIVADILKKHL